MEYWILTWWVLLSSTGLWAAEVSDPRVEQLERRVEVLEQQNRELLEALRALGAIPEGDDEAGQAQSAPNDTGASTVDSSTESDPTHIRVSRSGVDFYGFVRLDAIYDDSRPNAQQTPTFILSEDPTLRPRNEDSYAFHPRLTRFGMNFDGPRLGANGPALGGKLEIDFQNGGRESRQIPRLRHGYLTLDWASSSLLMGQTWDLISPLYPTVNSDTLMWNAGNLGDRRPQIRASRTHTGTTGKLTAALGLGLTGAIDAQDLDGDGIRDGEDATLPHVQGRIAYSLTAGSPFTIGLSGHFGREEVSSPVAGLDRFDTHSIGLDFRATRGKATFQLELWQGENLSDFRGGIGQGVAPGTGREIESHGGWLEVGLQLTRRYSIYGGYTVDDPDDQDLGAGARTKNSAWSLVQRWRFDKSLLVGLDFLRWTTEFEGLDDGTDNRFNLYIIYDF